MFQKIYKDSFKNELEKIALSTEGVEDNLSTVLTPEQLNQTEKLGVNTVLLLKKIHLDLVRRHPLDLQLY